MKTGLFFDTESTGFPIWSTPSGDPQQPHIVQLAAFLVNLETKEIIESVNVVVKPDGWVIPEESIDIHGITNELAHKIGIPESAVIGIFMNLWNVCDIRIAHNTTFDNRMIGIGLKRYMPNLVSDEVWKDRNLYYCTLMNFKKLIGGKKGHTLGEAYKYFTGKELDGAHNAVNDTKACMDVYFGMQKELPPF